MSAQEQTCENGPIFHSGLGIIKKLGHKPWEPHLVFGRFFRGGGRKKRRVDTLGISG